MSLIVRAAQFAAECHKDQKRKYTNRPYIEHPIRVAGKVATMPWADSAYVAAAFLHDVVEDCGVDVVDLRYDFGSIVAGYVKALTNPSKGSTEPRKIRKEMDRKHLSICEPYLQQLKLIDRLDNLFEMDHTDPFVLLYCDESILLVQAIGACPLGDEIQTRCDQLVQMHMAYKESQN